MREVSKQVLPLKKTAGIYHSSSSMFDFNDMHTTTIYKRFCEKYLDMRRMRKGTIDRGRGFFRDFMISLPYLPARRITFYACGNKREIARLLSGLPGLGKKTAIGFGFVNSFEIEALENDISIISNGMAMRPIPTLLLKSYDDVAILNYKSPYWAYDKVAPCAPPLSRVLLSKNFTTYFPLGQELEKWRNAG